MSIDFWDPRELDNRCITKQDWQEIDYTQKIETLKSSPHTEKHTLESQAYDKVKQTIEHAYKKTKSYQQRFKEAGVSPSDLQSLADLSKFPILEKKDFEYFQITDFIAGKYIKEKLFRAQTCGTTSGNRQTIYFDKEAVLNDTLQAIQQLNLQQDPNNPVQENDLVVHYYVNPWWCNSVNGLWRSAFIPSDTPPAKAALEIKKLNPSVLSGYPSDLSSLMDHIGKDELNLKLIITNSEFSTRSERDVLSEYFECNTLDEYSSEELTRIALELPDGGYYVNHDSVYLEVFDPVTRKPTPDGEWGEAVVTGLLNNAMPYIRYATGDWVRKPIKNNQSDSSLINWQKLTAIGGRIIDSLVTIEGKIIPQNAILNKLDWTAIQELKHIFDYRIYQINLEKVIIAVDCSTSKCSKQIDEFVKYAKMFLYQQIGGIIDCDIIKTNKNLFEVDHEIADLPQSIHEGKKRRRIRFLGDIREYMTEHNRRMAHDWGSLPRVLEALNLQY